MEGKKKGLVLLNESRLFSGHDEVTITLPPAVSMQQNQHHIDDNGSGDCDGNGNGKEDLDLHKR